MSESQSHKIAKKKAAGKNGETEVPLPGGKFLDAANKDTASEIERSGTKIGLDKAVQRLKLSKKPKKVLQVPQKDLNKAADALRRGRTGGTAKNMSGTNSIKVNKPRSKPKK